MPTMTADERYSRQIRYAPIGAAGQNRLCRARIAIVGCGALGAATAEQLARAGVGFLRLIDRDFVEWSNLQRQCLYTEADAAANRPKAVAAAAHLAELNAEVTTEAVVTHIDQGNVAGLLADVDLVCDGTDNFATRHLVNEACCRTGTPWIYTACVGAYALCLPIVPGRTPCLRCLQDELPLAGDGPTCDSAGIIAPAVHQAASWQVVAALRLLVAGPETIAAVLQAADLWDGTSQRMDVNAARRADCRACGAAADHPALHAARETGVVLCGRDAVQLRRSQAPDLAAVRSAVGDRLVTANEHLIRWRDGEHTLTLFGDGRFLAQGVADAAQARSLADRWLG